MNIHPHGIVVYPNRARLFVMAGVLLGIAGLLVIVMRDPAYAPRKLTDYLVPVLCIFPVLIGGAVAMLIPALWSGASLVIEEDGIFANPTGGRHGVCFIPWDNVAGIHVTVERRSVQLCLVLHEPLPRIKVVLEHQSLWAALSREALEHSGGPNLTIPQEMLSMPIPDLLREIERHYPAQLHKHGIVVDAGE